MSFAASQLRGPAAAAAATTTGSIEYFSRESPGSSELVSERARLLSAALSRRQAERAAVAAAADQHANETRLDFTWFLKRAEPSRAESGDARALDRRGGSLAARRKATQRLRRRAECVINCYIFINQTRCCGFPTIGAAPRRAEAGAEKAAQLFHERRYFVVVVGCARLEKPADSRADLRWLAGWLESH